MFKNIRLDFPNLNLIYLSLNLNFLFEMIGHAFTFLRYPITCWNKIFKCKKEHFKWVWALLAQNSKCLQAETAAWTEDTAVRDINHILTSPGVTVPLIRLCSVVSLTCPDVLLRLSQVRFNGHGLGSQFPPIINPPGPRITGAVIRSLTLTSQVLIDTQAHRRQGIHW